MATARASPPCGSRGGCVTWSACCCLRRSSSCGCYGRADVQAGRPVGARHWPMAGRLPWDLLAFSPLHRPGRLPQRLGFPRRLAAAVGRAALRPARYRDHRPHPVVLRAWGALAGGGPFAAAAPDELVPAAGHVHGQRVGPEPRAQRRRGRAQDASRQRWACRSKTSARLFSQAAVGIAQVDTAGRFRLVNDGFCEIVRRPAAERPADADARPRRSRRPGRHGRCCSAAPFRTQKALPPRQGTCCPTARRRGSGSTSRPCSTRAARCATWWWPPRTSPPVATPRTSCQKEVEERTATLKTASEVLHTEIEQRKRVEDALKLDIAERRKAQEALMESEWRFRLVIQGVTDYAIFMLDTDGNITHWNMGAQRIHQYTAAEITGQHFSRFYTEEERQRGEPARALQVAAYEGKHAVEGRRVRRDESEFWAGVVIEAIRDEVGNARRLREHHSRHHRAARSASLARAGAGAARPVAEDGGARPVDRQHRPRFQQSADDRQRPRPAAAPPAHRSQASAGDRGGPLGGQSRREPHPPASGLLAAPAAQPGRRRPQGTHRGRARDAGRLAARQRRAQMRHRRGRLAGRGRRRRARARAGQCRGQRQGRHARRRQHHAVGAQRHPEEERRRGSARGRLRGAGDDRYRRRHCARRAAANLRAVLHHQGARQGHRARPVAGLRLLPPVGRHRGRDQQCRQRHRDHHLSAAQARGAGQGRGGARHASHRRRGRARSSWSRTIPRSPPSPPPWSSSSATRPCAQKTPPRRSTVCSAATRSISCSATWSCPAA